MKINIICSTILHTTLNFIVLNLMMKHKGKYTVVIPYKLTLIYCNKSSEVINFLTLYLFKMKIKKTFYLHHFTHINKHFFFYVIYTVFGEMLK